MSISLPRYYQLEARALAGLVAALTPHPQGRQPSLENRVKALEKELAAAQRKCARQEALVRVTQRTLGLAIAVPAKSAQPVRDAKGRKKRRPTVRALKAARAFEAQAHVSATAASAGQADGHPLQQAAPDSSAEEVRPCLA